MNFLMWFERRSFRLLCFIPCFYLYAVVVVRFYVSFSTITHEKSRFYETPRLVCVPDHILQNFWKFPCDMWLSISHSAEDLIHQMFCRDSTHKNSYVFPILFYFRFSLKFIEEKRKKDFKIIFILGWCVILEWLNVFLLYITIHSWSKGITWRNEVFFFLPGNSENSETTRPQPDNEMMRPQIA